MSDRIHYDIAAARAAILRNLAAANETALASAKPELRPLVDAQIRLNAPSVEVMVTMMQLENEGMDPALMRQAQVCAAAHYLRLILQLEENTPLSSQMLYRAVEIAADTANLERRKSTEGSYELPVIEGGRA